MRINNFPELNRKSASTLGPSWYFIQGLRHRFKPKPPVFVISQGKTGTTSLGKALQKLGYIVAGGYYDLKNYQNVSFNHLWRIAQKYLSSHNAFQDTPWYIFYQDVYNLYPGAKFIFLDRDVHDWYESLVRHQGGVYNNFYKRFYGVANVADDPSLVKSNYLKHRKDVMDFFKEKDCILFTTIKDLTYQDLCKFLNLNYLVTGNLPEINKRGSDKKLRARLKRYLKKVWVQRNEGMY